MKRQSEFPSRLAKLFWLLLGSASVVFAANTLLFYYAHSPTTDKYGVIAPWYTGQNGQYDYRVRIAAETLKRYPWVTRDKAVMPAPEYVYDGTWHIDDEGHIRAVPERDWDNGDVGQRAAYIFASAMEYYRYSGDPAVLTAIQTTADYLVDYCQTETNRGWPKILISVPTAGKRYGPCVVDSNDRPQGWAPPSWLEGKNEPHGTGKIQLDIVAEVGTQMVRAYEMTGNKRWYDAAKHWADLLAENRNREPGKAPWGRYADTGSGKGMNGVQTGGIVYILIFFDELIRTGYAGQNGEIVAARDAGRIYLRDVLLPRWAVNDTWGRNYWDWENPVQDENVSEFAADYLLDHKDFFRNWKTDVRNILSLFLTHTSASPLSRGDTYHGAWAYPESDQCCGRSLWYPANEVSLAFARYGVESGSAWATEIARRSQLLATYDPLPDGQSNDLIDGGAFVNLTWFKIAHPQALKHVLLTMGWLPDVAGANRENHIMRTSSVLKRVIYDKGSIQYFVFDAPTNSIDVLRLSFVPSSIIAGEHPLSLRQDLDSNGYTIQDLAGGDAIVSIRHDGLTDVAVQGKDPQDVLGKNDFKLNGAWRPDAEGFVSSAREASFTAEFNGNQVRLVASSTPSGGYADVFLDDIKQLCPIDFFAPVRIDRQILYYRNGLTNGTHRLRIISRGQKNPLSQGTDIYVQSLQYSDATGAPDFGEGRGPTDTQRMILGYARREDYLDSSGNRWRPATEFVARTGNVTDVVAKTWWTLRQAVFIGQTSDPELYRYGAHWREFWLNVTVAPGAYHVRLKFAETQCDGPSQRAMSIYINKEKQIDGFDVYATAGGKNRPVDLVYDNIQPKNGVIEIRLVGDVIDHTPTEAILQAVEVGPGLGGNGNKPQTVIGVQVPELSQ